MSVLISIIIPTIGRITLSRAVQSVLDPQLNDADCEEIVVNDSGNPLREASWKDASNGFASLEMLRGGDKEVELTSRISLAHDVAGRRELVALKGWLLSKN